MSTNATVIVSLTTEKTHASLLSEERFHTIYLAFRYVLLPCTSVLGIVGNVTSIVILTRRGFKKCSNVLLMALSVSDVLFLIGVNNIPMYLYLESMPPGFKFSDTVNYFLYIWNIAFLCAYSVGLMTALVVPALITGERLLVILTPFKVYFILTARRVMVVVSCLYILGGTYFFYCYIICMEFKQVVLNDFTIGIFVTTDVYARDVRSGMYGLLESIVNYMTGIIPISIVTSGCIVTGIQVTLITHRRKQLTSGQVKPGINKSPSRTTKMLLSICVLYVVCSGFGFLVAYVLAVKPVDQDDALKSVLGSIRDLLLCVNCVGDFVIYIRANSTRRRSSDDKR